MLKIDSCIKVVALIKITTVHLANRLIFPNIFAYYFLSMPANQIQCVEFGH